MGLHNKPPLVAVDPDRGPAISRVEVAEGSGEPG
jgi:hypothetical protein